MLAQQSRFHGRRDIQRVYKQGSRSRTKRLGLHVVAAPGGLRAAVVVSKKISKSAVVRNRIRRRLYELLREYEKQTTLHTALVLTVYDVSIATDTAERVRDEFDQLLSKGQSGVGKASRRAIVERQKD